MPKKTVHLVIPDELLDQEAQRIFQAICKLNPQDGGVKRFAQRTARAITLYNGGFIQETTPLAKFILFGDYHTDLRQYVKALADKWIGPMPNGVFSYVYIDCAGLATIRGSCDLSPLLGPPKIFKEQNIVQLPLLAKRSVIHADFTKRQEAKYNALEAFQNQFYAKHDDQFQKFGGVPRTIHQRFEDEYDKILNEGEPYRSVIVFDNAQYAPADLISDVMRPILYPALLNVIDGAHQTKFNTSIVVILMHDRWDYLKHSKKGFGPVPDNVSENGAQYRKVRRELLRDPLFSGLMDDVADNLILIGPLTPQQQFQRFKDKLQTLSLGLEHYFQITLEWDDAFVQLLVDESFDKDIEGFTEHRTEGTFQKCVGLLLASQTTSGALKRGSTLKFSVKINDKINSKSPMCTIIKSSKKTGDAPITSSELYNFLQTYSQTKKDAGEQPPAQFEFLTRLEGELNILLATFNAQWSKNQAQREPASHESTPESKN